MQTEWQRQMSWRGVESASAEVEGGSVAGGKYTAGVALVAVQGEQLIEQASEKQRRQGAKNFTSPNQRSREQ